MSLAALTHRKMNGWNLNKNVNWKGTSSSKPPCLSSTWGFFAGCIRIFLFKLGFPKTNPLRNSMNKAEKKADWQMTCKWYLKKDAAPKIRIRQTKKSSRRSQGFLKFYLRRHCLLVGGSEFICNGCLVKFRFSKREAPRETCWKSVTFKHLGKFHRDISRP